MDLTWRIKMHESLYCSLIMILLVASLTGTEPVSESVCKGDSVPLFQNVKLSKDDPVNVYINGQKQELICTWFSTGGSCLPKYGENMFADLKGTIWFRNIEQWNEGKYVLSYGSDASNVKSQVLINVMVAPTSFCKPKIKKVDNLLIAKLDFNNCGIPSAHVQWLEHPDISYRENEIAKLLPDKKAGTYYACAESIAQRCVKALKISDYCSNFTFEDVPNQVTDHNGRDKGAAFSVTSQRATMNQVYTGRTTLSSLGPLNVQPISYISPPVSSDVSGLMTAIYMMGAITMLFVIAVTIVLIMFRLHRRKKPPYQMEMVAVEKLLEDGENQLETDDNKSMRISVNKLS